MKRKVIVAGHICLDITPVFPAAKSGSIGEILLPGKLIQMKEADVHTGGAVANTGLAMRILRADVSLMGKVGKDAFGEMVVHILESYGTANGMLVSEGESTSYSVVLAVPGTDRIFLHNPGANDSFRAADIPEEELREACLFHFGYPPLMKSMYENEGEELCAVFRKAKECGCATSLDLAAVDADSEAGKADWKGILKKVLPYVDFFVPSVEELCFMLDRKKFEELSRRAGGADICDTKDICDILDIEADVKPLAEQCLSYGAKAVLIKCGARGMYYRTADSETLNPLTEKLHLKMAAWADREGVEASYKPERILSGTGAGDTSIAAFLTAVLEGCSLEESIRLAAAEGASCVAAYDALSGLKSLDELRAGIAAGWEKV